MNYKNLEGMMIERGRKVDHSINNGIGIDETHIKVKDEWKYLCRVVDSDGDTTDFMLSTKRNR